MSSPSPATLTGPRLLSYAATWAFGVVACGSTLNGLIKARHTRDDAAAYAVSISPLPDTSVDININDILTVGGFLAAGELLTCIVAFYAFLFLLPSVRSHSALRNLRGGRGLDLEKSRGAQSVGLGWWLFAWIWTFVTAVITAVWGKNRQAKTSASVGGVELPASVVKSLQAATGIDPHYWVHGYTKFLVIAPWPLLFFMLISIALTLLAYKRTNYSSVSPDTSFGGARTSDENDGVTRLSGSIEENEKKPIEV